MPGVEDGKEGDCQDSYSFQRAEHESAERVMIFFFLILQSTVMPWRPQQMKSLYSQPVCVLSIRQRELITSWQRNSLQNQLWGSLFFLKKKKKACLLFKRELGQPTCPWRACQYEQLLPSPFIYLSPQHTRTCFSLSLNLQLCKIWEVPRGLFICHENFPFQKIFSSPGGWLSLTPTTATSPFC